MKMMMTECLDQIRPYLHFNSNSHGLSIGDIGKDFVAIFSLMLNIIVSLLPYNLTVNAIHQALNTNIKLPTYLV